MEATTNSADETKKLATSLAKNIKTNAFNYVKAPTPGSDRPDSSASIAPPPVEIKFILSKRQADEIADIVSPPPIILYAEDSETALAIWFVPKS